MRGQKEPKTIRELVIVPLLKESSMKKSITKD